MSVDVEALLAELTLEEKVLLLSGSDTWRTFPVERLGVPAIKVTDGPNGARGDSTTGARAVCLPASIGLAASFDTDLVTEVGQLLGTETARKGAHVLLAPTINIARHPLGGRNFESFGEDPLLTSQLAVAYVSGVQDVEGVGACAKHFVANDVEYARLTVSSEIDERTLREVYLAPFEAVVEAGVWSLMASYPKLNGQHCTEHHWLLTELLRDEWGFDGLVMSDWGATHHPVRPVVAGLDLEMPGPPLALGRRTLAAVEAGELDESVVDERARRVLELVARAGRMDVLDEQPEQSIDRPEDRSLARRAATAGMVLLRNSEEAAGVATLPLDPGEVRSLAVVGPNAINGVIQGGGSAELPAHAVVSPVEGLADVFDTVVAHPGCLSHRYLPAVPAESWSGSDEQPIRLEIFANDGTTDAPFESSPAIERSTRNIGVMIAGGIDGLPEPMQWAQRWTGSLQVDEAGTHHFGVFAVGPSRVFVNGELVADNWTESEPGDGFFQKATAEVIGSIELDIGTAEIVVEWVRGDDSLLAGLRFGWLQPIDEDALLDEAVAAAADADAAVVVVGLDANWETESHDRPMFGLPGRQDELVRRVAAVNPRTVIVLNAGGPVDLPWLDDVPATLVAWYPGQEFGAALADVISGVADPGGRLPVTFPFRMGDAPTHLDVPGDGDHLHYREGVFVGHRWYDTRDIEPRAEFGAGQSYASFSIGQPTLVGVGAGERVRVPVTNTSDRSGTCVLQLYAEPPASAVRRPVRSLAGFTSVELGPGEEADLDLAIGRQALRIWNGETWQVPSGTYRLHVGTSSRRFHGSVDVDR